MNFKFYLIILLFIYCCNKADTEIENISNGKIFVIGHGGIGFQSERNQLPHNSFTSINKAIDSYGADGVEVDVQMSKDSILILYHDATLQSMTNCTGCIYNYDYDELINCRFRNDFYVNVFSEEYIIKLEDILSPYKETENKPLIFLDIKLILNCYNNFPADEDQFLNKFAGRITLLIKDHHAEKSVNIQSNSLAFLKGLQKITPDLNLILETADPSTAIKIAAENSFFGIICRNDDISKEQVKFAHSSGLTVSIFSVKTREGTIKAINKHPDFIQTDNIILLQQCLKKN